MANLEAETPSSPVYPSDNPFSLSERINIATRPVHSQLNRLILARLPLALPPHTINPSVYVSGLLHITPIYINFETLWDKLLNAPQLPTTLNEALDSCELASQQISSKTIPIILETREGVFRPGHASKVCSRTRSVLAHLRLPELLRAGRLKTDISDLTGTPEHQLEVQLDDVSKTGRLAEFIAHTTRSVDANPHVLLAYAWVLYMAIFSGGRYLRASLKEAGGVTDFWSRKPSPVRPYSVTCEPAQAQPNPPHQPRSETDSYSAASSMIPGLSFFNFPGTLDGEDLKLEFKKRFAEAEVLLTEGEKGDIIQEAQEIFRFMVELVDELDNVMRTSEEDLEAVARPRQPSIFKNQRRESVIVHKERILNTETGDNATLVASEAPCKHSFLQLLGTEPATAKFVHFNDNWGSVVTPLKTKLSGNVSPGLSIDSSIAMEKPPSSFRTWDYLVRGTIPLLPLGAIVAVFLAWHFTET